MRCMDVRAAAKKELAAKLRRQRIEAGVTKRPLAERTGFSQSKVSAVENGVCSIKPIDVSSWLRIVGARDSVRESLTRDAEAIHSGRLERWSFLSESTASRYVEQFDDLDSDSSTVR